MGARSIETMSESDLERELFKVSRSRSSGTRVQARGAAIRSLLRAKQRRREQAEREQRAEQREREECQRSREPAEDDVVALSWAALDRGDTATARQLRAQWPSPSALLP